MTTAILVAALVLPWILIAFQSWLMLQLLRQHGQQLLTLEEIQERLDDIEIGSGPPAEATLPPPLPVGLSAPDFTLPDLDGIERSLSEFLGAPLLVSFFDLACGFCRQMAPELGQLPDEATRVLLVSRGDAEEHRRLAEESGWRCDVVLDQDREVGQAYAFRGTPTAYLLDEDGRIASDLAMGPSAVLALAGAKPSDSNGSGGSNGAERSRAAGLRVRDIGESRLNRDGLKAGTPAPDFTLPDVDGAERSLAEFRGRPVLLVFSDVTCAPCDALAPALVELHSDRKNDLEIVMISRGGRQANRRKTREHGYGFPVLLQRSWEVSKTYAMFFTPIGYLIDERGIVARDVAIGGDAILSLASTAST